VAKAKVQTKYNKLKTDGERVKFILTLMNEFQYNYLSRGLKRGTYEIGPWWDNITIDTDMFKTLKPKLRQEVEGETGGPVYYWSYKDSKNI